MTALVDGYHIRRLRSALGHERFNALVRRLLNDFVQRPINIRDHLINCRLGQAVVEAAYLKAAALSVGADRLVDAALAIEQCANPDDIKINVRLIDDLDQAVAETLAALDPLTLDGGAKA